MSNHVIIVVSEGPLHAFADWPNLAVPKFGAGVYTIWHTDGRFIYVGMSGRSITETSFPRNTPQIAAIAAGRHQMDAFVLTYIHDHLRSRYCMMPDGAQAYAAETATKGGKLQAGQPLLDPGTSRAARSAGRRKL